MLQLADATKGLEELKASDSTHDNDDDEHSKNLSPCIFSMLIFVSNVY